MQCDFLDYTGGILSGGYYCKKDNKYVIEYTTSKDIYITTYDLIEND